MSKARAVPKVSGLLNLRVPDDQAPAPLPSLSPPVPKDLPRGSGEEPAQAIPINALQQPGAALSSGSLPHGRGDSVSIHVSLDRLDDNPYNARTIYSPLRVRELRDDIKANGLRYPLIVVRTPADPSRFWIIDGHTRHRAAKLLGLELIECRLADNVNPLNGLDLYSESYRLNDLHTPMTDIDKGMRWAAMITDEITSASEIAAAIGVDVSVVSRMCVYAKLPTALVQVITETPARFPYNTAVLLQKACEAHGPDAAERLARQHVSEHWTRRDLEQNIARLSKQAQSRTRAPRSRQIDLRISGTKAGTIKTYSSPEGARLVCDVANLPQDKVDGLAAHIQAFFGTDGS